jgi:hypothetical protein
VLVRDGQPAATIVIAASPTSVAKLGAQELQYHVQRITGATLPIKSDSDKVEGPRVLVGFNCDDSRRHESKFDRTTTLPSHTAQRSHSFRRPPSDS